MQKRRPNPYPIQLTPSLEKRLTAYTLTAVAAGLGVAFATPGAEAKVIYIPANKILTSGTFALPAGGGSRSGWTFFDGFHNNSFSFDNLSVRPMNGAAVSVANGYAPALGSGASIGPNKIFQSTPTRMEKVTFLSDSSLTQAYGPWANVSNRYLGLRILINGETHYGWARFSVANSGSLTSGVHIKATFTGYAYETIANRPIQAGATTGPVEAANSGSLGCLAMGCAGRDLIGSSK